MIPLPALLPLAVLSAADGETGLAGLHQVPLVDDGLVVAAIAAEPPSVPLVERIHALVEALHLQRPVLPLRLGQPLTTDPARGARAVVAAAGGAAAVHDLLALLRGHDEWSLRVPAIPEPLPADLGPGTRRLRAALPPPVALAAVRHARNLLPNRRAEAVLFWKPGQAHLESVILLPRGTAAAGWSGPGAPWGIAAAHQDGRLEKFPS